ncbi:MAG: ATP-binding cassette domain-containing protein [Halanaeroarchaeum sp.]
MTAIEATGLTKRYGRDVVAVDGLDLRVERGEIFGFLGPNGAGKSTTIDMLLDFVRPTAGSATVLGHDVTTASEAVRERVGVLPDDYGLYDRLTGLEHLEYAIRLKDADDDPLSLLDRVGLDERAGRRHAGDYSTGMTQRLVLSIALVGDPDLLILDEPSSGLDPNGVRLVRDIARETAADGGTVFFSSHILPQVEAVCDRVAILDRGRLVAVDTIDGLRDSLDTGSIISVTVDAIPPVLDVRDIDGVSAVTVEDRTLTATVRTPEGKLAVIDELRDAGASVLDFSTTEASLEELFQAYTGDSTESPADTTSDTTEASR